MALVQNCIPKVRGVLMHRRHFSSQIQKSVFISQSHDIFENLALEDWFYRNFDFKNHHVLMLWQNNPCVVIGRHQNPWLEANVANLKNITENGVQLARRNSGGGTVYHDQGNLNLTFFTPKECYNRKYNLEIIKRAVFREFGLKIDISPREDLVIRNSKVSGTAAKLGRPNAYHHCTLLVNANKVDLSQALQKPELDIKTNATKSIRSKIMNLCEENPNVAMEPLISAIGWEYMRTPAFSLKDGGMELAQQQRGFQMINPTEKWFEGITEIRDTFQDWEWCFGRTPKFTISKTYTSSAHTGEYVTATLTIDKGRIADISLYLPAGVASSGFTGTADVISSLKGQKFTDDVLYSLEHSLGCSDKFISQGEQQAMASL